MNININNKDFKIQKGNLFNEELESLSSLFKRVFKKNIPLDFIKWYYCDNPNGKAISHNIILNNNIIGHYALIPIKIRLYDGEFKAALSVFTAIDKEYRGMYLFNELANRSFEIAKSEGIKFIVGVSNNLSTKLFIRYFKFKLISQLDVKIGIGNLKKKDNKADFKVLWDSKLIKWRLNNPRFNYKSKIIKDEVTIYNNIYKFFSIEVGRFFVKEFPEMEKNLLKKKFNLFNLWIGLGSYNWEKTLYFNLPEKLKPAPLNLIIKNLQDEKNEIFLEKEKIKFQLIDFDIF